MSLLFTTPPLPVWCTSTPITFLPSYNNRRGISTGPVNTLSSSFGIATAAVVPYPITPGNTGNGATPPAVNGTESRYTSTPFTYTTAASSRTNSNLIAAVS